MKAFEIVDFYPTRRDKAGVSGTLHVYFTEIGIDLRGIFYTQKNDHIFVKFPCGWGMDCDALEKVSFPIFNLTDSEGHRRLIEDVKKAATEYIKGLDEEYWSKWKAALVKMNAARKPVKKKIEPKKKSADKKSSIGFRASPSKPLRHI